MIQDIAITIQRTLIALSIGASLGFILGVILSLFHSQLIETLISALMTIPGMALAPLAIMLLGFGDKPIVLVGVIAALFPATFNTLVGLQTVPSEIVEASQVDGANRWQILTKIKIPVASSTILTGIELALSKAWRTVIAVEFVAATNNGIGYAMWEAAEYLRFDKIVVFMIMTVIIHLIMNRALKIATKPLVIESC